MCKAVGLESACVPRMASGFGGGIAGHGEACGGVTGGMMALGLLHGRDNADDPELKSAISDKAKRFVAQFMAHNGAIRCAEITGVDLRTEEGQQMFGEQNTHAARCSPAVASAVRVVLTLHNEWESNGNK